MKKKKISWILIAGILLLSGSLCLMAVFQIRASVLTREGRATAAEIQKLLPERTTDAPAAFPGASMPALSIDGKDYIALLEIPAMGVNLPVSASWESGAFLPGRFWGSIYGDGLAIGGTDYPGQFDFCSKIDNGTPISLTDMTGAQFTYTVARVDRAAKAESQWLLDENFDLTLFCRGMFSTEYIAVRCVFSYK